jgi:hypothetical protein
MPEQTMAAGVDPNSARKVVDVRAPQDMAWRVFTERMGAWWPLATYKIGKAKRRGRCDRAARRWALVRKGRRREHL